MNKFLAVILLLSFNFVYSQSPKSFKYQAVVRNSMGVLLYNQIISVKSSILMDNPNGTVVYSEYQTLSTNEYGVVNLNIGEGSSIAGNFENINWGESSYFIKTELDLTGTNSNYVFMGTSQIMSVPYALYADKASRSLNDNDTSSTNELQNLSINGNNLSISNGNSVVLPPDADSDPTNELQTLEIIGDSLKISNGNTVKIKTEERYLGEYFQGGLIFHLYKDTLGIQHGLIMPKNWNFASLSKWSINPNFYGATSKWDGLANSNLINDSESLIEICRNYEITDNYGVFNDWYLPSVNEMKLLLRNSSQLEFFLFGNIFINDGDQFWTSTEFDSVFAVAVTYNQFDYILSTSKRKDLEMKYYVPIRKF